MARRTLKNRKHYDPNKEVVCARAINTGGKSYGAGEPMNDVLDERVRAKFWATGRILYADEFSPVKIADEPIDEPAEPEAEVKAVDETPVDKIEKEQVGEATDADVKTKTRVDAKLKVKAKSKPKG